MKRLLASIVFVVLLLSGIFLLNRAVQPNDDRDAVWNTYQKLERNSVDALFVGTSKTFTVFNPGYLWNKYHFSSYNLSGALLDYNTAYYYLKQAFKTQKPKVVVLDALTISLPREKFITCQKKNISLLPFGSNKICASMHPDIESTERINWILPFEQYHSRKILAQNLGKNDYIHGAFGEELSSIFFGYVAFYTSKPSRPEHQPVEVPSSFEENYKELSRIINYLQRQNCKVIIVNTPTTNLTRFEWSEKKLSKRLSRDFPEVQCIWSSNNYQKLKIDTKSDFIDDIHLNIWGAEKFGSFVGVTIRSKLDKVQHKKTLAYGETTKMLDDLAVRYDETRRATEQGK